MSAAAPLLLLLLHQNVAVRKVKVLKAPKFDLSKLMEVHGDYTEEVGRTWGCVPVHVDMALDRCYFCLSCH